MGLFKRGGAVADVIRCDEPDYLIWKWSPVGAKPNAKRQNAIRWGSSLRVKEGSVAVFVYKQKGGVVQDYIEGPFDEFISTKNLPILSGLIGLAYDGNSPFQAEIYFINLAKIIQSKFVVPYFDIFDPRFADFSVPAAVRGTLSFKIADYKEFIKLHRMDEFSHEQFDKQIKDAVTKYVKNVVANVPSKENISVLQLEQKLSLINDYVSNDITDRLAKDFGVSVSGVDISAIDIDKSSEGYAQLKAITQNVTTEVELAKKDAEVKNIQDLQRINMENYEESLRIQREEGAYAQHKQTQTSNMEAFKTEKQAEVGVAGAEALGKMGANGGGAVNIGGGESSGFNPAAMMASMAMGRVVATNVVGTMNDAMNPNVVPPIPETVYNVAVNGQATGPFDVATLTAMAQSGQINGETLVWKPGMSAWAQLKTVSELKNVLTAVPPEI